MGGLCDGSFGQQWSVFDLEADTAAMVAEMSSPAKFKFELVGMTIDAFDEGTFVAGVADATGEDEENVAVESVRHVSRRCSPRSPLRPGHRDLLASTPVRGHGRRGVVPPGRHQDRGAGQARSRAREESG
jgi:hypothetical protein